MLAVFYLNPNRIVKFNTLRDWTFEIKIKWFDFLLLFLNKNSL